MNILYFFALILVGVISALPANLIPKNRYLKNQKCFFFIIIVACLLFQGWYGFVEKSRQDRKSFENEWAQKMLSNGQVEISKDIQELKEKSKKGLLTDTEYQKYIAYYLENINLTLKRSEWKNMREWVATYHENVGSIPAYFNQAEWKASEKFIYDSLVKEIVGGFVSRNTFTSGVKEQVLSEFKENRDRLVSAKGREFVQSSNS